MADYYTAASDPANDSDLDSSVIRAEWTALALGFTKVAGYTGNGGKILAINSGGTAQEAITTTGTGNGVRATSPTLVTPVLGVATATSINKITLTQPAAGATLTLTDGKTLAATNTLTLSGTDGTVMTFPSTSASIARTDAANTFTGVQGMTSPSITTSIVTPSASFDVFNTVATTVNAFGAASVALNIGNASAAAAFPGGISIAASKSITGNVANSTISGFLSVAATTGTFTNVGGTLSTAAQPNITSVGTLTSLTSSGAISGMTGTFTNNANSMHAFSILNSTSGTAAGSQIVMAAGTSSFVLYLLSQGYSSAGIYQATRTVMVASGQIDLAPGATVALSAVATGVTIPGTLGVTGALTTNGGLQTFGANDTGGAGYRLVLVPNI